MNPVYRFPQRRKTRLSSAAIVDHPSAQPEPRPSPALQKTMPPARGLENNEAERRLSSAAPPPGLSCMKPRCPPPAPPALGCAKRCAAARSRHAAERLKARRQSLPPPAAAVVCGAKQPVLARERAKNRQVEGDREEQDPLALNGTHMPAPAGAMSSSAFVPSSTARRRGLAGKA